MAHSYGTLPGSLDDVTKNQLGMVNGVVVPCLLNILGVILFLRLGWAVGQAGLLGVLFMFGVGESLALLTVFSLSAIVSNGRIKGGGSYYMISRCLGPEFGGAIGLLFYSAYAVGTAFYVIGFSTEIVQSFIITEAENNTTKPSSLLQLTELHTSFDNQLKVDSWMGWNEQRWTTVVSSVVLFCVTGISLVGANFFTKVNGIVFFFQFAAILVGLCSMWFASPQELASGGEYLGLSFNTTRNNAMPDFTHDEKCKGKCSLSIVFSIIFPAMTGIMEGANLSGDLKDPSKMIGPGTVIAVGCAVAVYGALIFSFAAGFPRYTLKSNILLMQDLSPSKYILILGVAISAGSSALGSLFGGSRVLQALARDDLPFYGLSFFSKGSLDGDEPRRAVMMTWLIAQCCCLLGDLDTVSPIISSFFCMAYAAVNLSCFALEVSGTPNFRPTWKCYSRWTALAGFMLNIVVLFYLNALSALVSILVLMLLIVWIGFKGKVKDWGDISQAIIFHQVRKYLLRLDERKEHPKFWRPSVLLFVGSKQDVGVVRFCNQLKKGGLYVLGSVVIGDLKDLSKEVLALRRAMMTMIERENIKALPQISIGTNARLGCQNLMLCSGLGGMRPNTVVLPLLRADSTQDNTVGNGKEYYQRMALSLLSDSGAFVGASEEESSIFSSSAEYINVVTDALTLGMNILITCNFNQNPDGLNPNTATATQHTSINNTKKRLIDVYLVGQWKPEDLSGSLSLMLQLSHIISLSYKSAKQSSTSDNGKGVQENRNYLKSVIRFVNVVGDDVDENDALNALRKLSVHTRIKADPVVVRTNTIQYSTIQYNTNYCSELNSVIQENSAFSDIVFIVLPNPTQPNTMENINRLVKDLPPTVLVGSGRRTNVIPQEL